MTTIKIYRNQRNTHKFIEVHNDGHYHNSVRQYMEFDGNGGLKNFTGDGKLHRWRKENLEELLEDYVLYWTDTEVFESSGNRVVIKKRSTSPKTTDYDIYLNGELKETFVSGYIGDVRRVAWEYKRYGKRKDGKSYVKNEKSL